MCDILGIPYDSSPTHDLFISLVHPDERAYIRKAAEAAWKTGQTDQLEFRIVRPDGEVRWVCARTNSTRDESGAILTTYGTILDITDAKVGSEALRKRERQLNVAERVAQLGSWERDVATNRLEWSDGMFMLWRADRGTFEPTVEDVLSAIHPVDRQRMRDTISRAPETEGYDTVFRVTPAHGCLCWFRGRATVLRDASGEVVKVVGTFQDMTTERVAEEELRASEERYRTIVETTHDGVWTIDSAGVSTFVNERMASMLGWSREEILGRPLVDFLDPDAWAAFVRREPGRRRGVSEQFETTVTRKDGNALAVLVAASALYDAQGRYAGALALLNDVTNWHRA